MTKSEFIKWLLYEKEETAKLLVREANKHIDFNPHMYTKLHAENDLLAHIINIAQDIDTIV